MLWELTDFWGGKSVTFFFFLSGFYVGMLLIYVNTYFLFF